MLIDWFTVGAQVINFVVLLWLMKHFLYQPILAAIGAREKRIADELADAARQKAGAEILRHDLLAQTQAFDAERATLLAHAMADAGVEHDRLLAEARTTADAARLNWQAQWQSARAAQSEQLERMVIGEVFAIARQALRDLDGVDLEERMVATVLLRLREMSPDASGPWLAALNIAAHEVPSIDRHLGARVRSRYSLAASSRTLIQAAVNESCGSTVPLRFETASDDVDGIEICAAGQRIAWTITDYLQSLRTEVQALGREAAMPSSKTPAPSPGANGAKVSTLALAVTS